MDAAILGKDAETRALHFLESHGLRCVARNYRCRTGEIDLIVQDQDSLVFVEVRYRRQSRFGSGAETVDWRKQSKLVACARHYLQRHPGAASQPCRFDVLSVSGTEIEIEWIRNAFEAPE